MIEVGWRSNLKKWGGLKKNGLDSINRLGVNYFQM
jgi:hypothetical protein